MRILETEKTHKSAYESGFLSLMEWDGDLWLSLFDRLPMPIVVYKPDGELMMFNREADNAFALEGQGMYLPDYLHPLVRNASRLELFDHGREIAVKSRDGQKTYTMLLRTLKLNGSKEPMGSRGPAAVVVAAGLEYPEGPAKEQMSDASDSLDQGMAMAGEMSQRVRGPLAGIELYASILGEELDVQGESALSQIIEEIRYSVREVNEYLTSVESMTEPLKLDLRKVNLADAVDDALVALESLFKARGVGVLVEQRDLYVEMDKSLITQMFLNILMNAVEAMPMGGRLVVQEEINQRGEIEVIFTDSGPGLDMMDAKKYFNPFYTTKNQPLGLGLPVSQRIAEAHQGKLVLSQDGDLGARVKVVFPYIPSGDQLGSSSIN
jgi:nitrogen-specific signal transduction histidine kinase